MSAEYPNQSVDAEGAPGTWPVQPLRVAPGPGSGPDGVPAAIALTPILAARYRSRDLERIRAAAPGSRLVIVSADGLADGPLDDVEVVLRGFLSGETFDRLVARMRSLRWVHSAAAGVEHVLTPATLARDLTITNARGVFSRPIAEYVLTMILAITRQLPQLLELQRERTWQPLEARELRDVTVGIVGLGSIGRAVGSLAATFGARVVAVSRHGLEAGAVVDATDPADPPATGEEGAAGALRSFRLAAGGGRAWLPELLAQSDFVVLALPLTPQTASIVGEAELAATKPGAWIINIARGALVDEAALVRALRDGPLGGAVLDAFRSEPLPPDSPFYDVPNVIVTPHTSWSSGRVLDRSVELFCENLRLYRRGAPLLNVVDTTAGY